MAKKFFDILPPDERTRNEQKRLVFRSQSKRAGRGFGLFWILLILIGGVFSLCFLYSFRFSRAEIEILPKTDRVSFNTEVSIRKDIEEVSLTEWAIPGRFAEEEKELSMEFPSSGKVSKKKYARGKIRVYNKYHQSVSLRKNTHFRSDEGKEFYTLKQIKIPANGYLDGVEVVADEPGPEYNIGPSKFSVPKLRRYSQRLFMDVYGESTEPMKGGFLGEVPEVKKEDLENAEKILLEKLFAQGKESLKGSLPQDYILLDDLIKQEVVEKSPLAKAGQELKSFVYKARVSSRGFIFKKADLEEFSYQFIQSQIGDKKIVEGSLDLDYSVEQKDLKEGNVLISLRASAETYSLPDFGQLKEKAKGKSATEAEYLLEKEEGISRAKIKLFPFWSRIVPQKEQKIEIINLLR